jgi:hypothetical protein
MRQFLSQTLHIFRKDVRGLWGQIAWTLGATLLFALWGILSANYGHRERLVSYQSLLTILLLLTWCGLTGMLVTAEPLVGDRPLWRTLPYCWRSLLAAKLLAIAVWILLPKILADMAVLAAHGFSIPAHLPGLLLSALALFLCLIPTAFVASVSPHPMVWSAVVFVGVPALVVWDRFFAAMLGEYDAAPPLWATTLATLISLAICLVALLVWQYARRRTLWVAALGLSALVVCPLAAHHGISWTTQFDLQTRLTSSPLPAGSPQVALDPDPLANQFIMPDPNGRRDVRLPVRLLGVPDEVTPVLQGATLSLRTPSGDIAAGDALPWRNVEARTAPGQRGPAALRFGLTASEWKRVYRQPVALRGVAYVALYGNLRSARIRAAGRWVDLGGVARCAMFVSKPDQSLPPLLHCELPFHARPGEFITTLRLPSLALNGRLVERTSEARLEGSTPFDTLPSSGELGPLTAFIHYRLSDTDTQPLIGFRELIGCVKVRFELPVILFRAPDAGMRVMLNRSVAQSGDDGREARRVLATVDVSLPPPPPGSNGWTTLLVAEDQSKQYCGYQRCPESGQPEGATHQQLFAFDPGAYYVVAAPAGVAFWNMLPTDYARLVAQGKRLVLRQGDDVHVDLTAPAR